MATKIFLDCNIILDVLDDKRTFHYESLQLFKKIELGYVIAFTSESVICSTDYILQKTCSKKFRNDFFSQLLANVGILTCQLNTINKSLKSTLSDLEDAILYQIAIDNKLDYFITNDAKLLQYAVSQQLSAMSPANFLAL